jgi:predicted AlkP superfamily phosphohydrolase/phosphomutase
MTAPHPRILFLALDAMDPDLISHWAGCGILPTFRSLFERAAHGPIRNPPGLFVGAVWPSFFTAASPARHGRYCYEQLVSGTYDIRRFIATDLKQAAFWSQLSAAGQRIAVVDVPKSPRATDLNGVQLVNWGTHDPDFGAVFETWPPSLAEEIKARFGSDPVGDCNLIDRTARGIAAFTRDLRLRIEVKTAICRELLERDDWDLFLAVFSESHCVGHQCWVVHDETHLSHDRVLAQAVGDPIRDIYQALDRAVGELLQRAGQDTAVFVLASHGMGPHYDGTSLLDEILQRLDSTSMERMHRLAARLKRGVLRRIPLVELPLNTLAVAHRRFFAIPNNDVCGGVRVNLIGREPCGRVQPGEQYDAVFAQLRRQLLELKNVDTGGPVACDLVRLDQTYRGPHLEDLPDFYVEWNREAPITRVTSPLIGTLHKPFVGVRTGDHKAEGFFWAMRPRVRSGGRIAAVSMTDLGPTIGALLDVPLTDVDGTPIAAIL